MANVKVKRGTEGPAHDPYSFTEITFYFTNKKRKPVVLHMGIGSWLKHGKRKYYGYYGYHGSKKYIDPEVRFERITGLPVHKALMMPDTIFHRSMRKYSKMEQHHIMQAIEHDRDLLRWAE